MQNARRDKTTKEMDIDLKKAKEEDMLKKKLKKRRKHYRSPILKGVLWSIKRLMLMTLS